MRRSIFKMGRSKQENAPQNSNNAQLLSIIKFDNFVSNNYILKCGNVAQFFIPHFISSISCFDMSVDSFACRSGILSLESIKFHW